MQPCSSCGARPEEGANFCVKCGMRLSESECAAPTDSRFDRVCPTLISLLDTARNKWFELSKELIADILPSGAGDIIHPELLRINVISLSEDQVPESFPFNTVDGETIEAAVICWQFINAIAFATEKKPYMSTDQFDKFCECLAKCIIPGSLWNIAFGGLFSSPQIDDQCLSEVLAHYLLNETTDSGSVRGIQAVFLKQSLPFLRGMSYLATAVAFGDATTASELMSRL